MSANDIEAFINKVSDSYKQNTLVKLTLSNKRDKEAELKNVFVKPVALKQGAKLNFVYRHNTKDITKNYDSAEAMPILRDLLSTVFYKADLFTTEADQHLTIYPNGKVSLLNKKASTATVPEAAHNREKKRYVGNDAASVYMHELGITTADGKVKSDKQDKYRQINKYVEIIDSVVATAGLGDDFTVVDMGAGKGYLTFALYDYLVNKLHKHPHVAGVEMREGLVQTCNDIAEQSGFDKLSFIQGSIDTAELPKADMLIALHACDIATDQAIYRGIQADSKVIICAPCCHKQVRKALQPKNELSSITKFGIMEERQAEILTDTIRALLMEAYGYKTKVFEFISTEHTPKNILIVGVKDEKHKEIKQDELDKVNQLKALFNIEYHQLERLLGLN